MIKWAKDLFPICRSITGAGIKKTIRYFKKINPEFKIIKFKTGKKVSKRVEYKRCIYSTFFWKKIC